MTALLSSRRSFITGLVSLVAAPAIVRAGSLMPVRTMIEPAYGVGPMMYAIREMQRDLVVFGSYAFWMDKDNPVIFRHIPLHELYR